jgi:hypothetical protein
MPKLTIVRFIYQKMLLTSSNKWWGEDMIETYLDRVKDIAYDCFKKDPEPAYKRVKEALEFAALVAFTL